MTVTLTVAGNSITPFLVLGYEWSTDLNSIVHPIIGRNYPDITYRMPGLRTGTLKIFCLTAEDAVAVEDFHRALGIYSLDDGDVPTANMNYVPVRDMGTVQQGGRARWVVSVGFQELPNSNTPVPPIVYPSA